MINLDHFNIKDDITPIKVFLYCCDSTQPCEGKNILYEELGGVVLPTDYLFKFRVSFFSIFKGWQCLFKLEDVDNTFPPIIQTAYFERIDDVLAFCMTPFLMLDVKEVDILYYHDKTTMTGISDIIQKWTLSKKITT